MTQKAGDNFFVYTLSLADIFVKLKPPLKISRSATVIGIIIYTAAVLQCCNGQPLPRALVLLQYSHLLLQFKKDSLL